MKKYVGLVVLFLGLMAPLAAIPGPRPIPVPVIRSSAPNKKIQILNESSPGSEVDVRGALVRGQINIVVFFADW